MGEIDFTKKLVKILDANVLQMIIKKATTKGFTVQGFTKNVWLAPEILICAALEKRKKGKYQSSIFLEALSEIEIDDEIVNLAKRWIQDKSVRDEIELKVDQKESDIRDRKRKENNTKEDNIEEEKIEEIEKDEKNSYNGEIQQLQLKNKKLQSVIQNLKIDTENRQKEILRLQKENGKLEKELEEKISENRELKDKVDILKDTLKKLENTIDSYKQENIRYQDILDKAPKVICFAKKNIDKERFPFYNVEQLCEWTDEYLDNIKWNEYKEIWVIESDFSYSEVLKMKKLPCNKIILNHNMKALIEKVGGYNDGYAR